MRFSISAAKQKGVLLLEALLGILIFSMGILALVGMQTIALAQVADAKYRTDAAFLANQVIGQMWVNRTNLATYAYGGGGGPPAVIAKWVEEVEDTLPGVTAANHPTIVVAGTQVTITIFWQPPGSATRRNHVAIAYINA
ncbi:MAG: hypothetical protein HY323_09740 [Betaproteobacteria bacterium]|nr:hypothetical protein [Betaproteobacteria bacterium]MBI3937247.1 hypothetical protein [Betaproteobacteria bacterium]